MKTVFSNFASSDYNIKLVIAQLFYVSELYLTRTVRNRKMGLLEYSLAKETDSLASIEFIHVHFEPVVTHGLHYTVF